MGATVYRCYVHLPGVALEEPLPLSDGVARTVGFDEFVAIDPSWAVESDYSKSPRTFWVTESEETPVGERAGQFPPIPVNLRPVMMTARRLHLAFICVTRDFLPVPNVSMTYATVVGTETTYRVIGHSGRTWLTAGVRSTYLRASQVAQAARIVKVWERTGVDADSPALAPLRAISAVSSGSLSAGAAMGLLLVALEGAVGTNPADGSIVQQLVRGVREYALEGDMPDLGARIGPLYAKRSDLVHGRAHPDGSEPDLLWTLDMLARVAERRTLPSNLHQPQNGATGG